MCFLRTRERLDSKTHHELLLDLAALERGRVELGGVRRKFHGGGLTGRKRGFVRDDDEDLGGWWWWCERGRERTERGLAASCWEAGEVREWCECGCVVWSGVCLVVWLCVVVEERERRGREFKRRRGTGEGGRRKAKDKKIPDASPSTFLAQASRQRISSPNTTTSGGSSHHHAPAAFAGRGRGHDARFLGARGGGIVVA